MLCSIAANLGAGELGEIGSLEKDLHTTLLAFACHPLEPADLGPEELTRVKALEDKLGVALVAVTQAA